MTRHDFNALFEKYPTIIGQMPDSFTSHKFILHIARQNQKLYIEALYDYRENRAPFKLVHGILAKHLNAYPQFVGEKGVVESIDIFTQKHGCAQWRKI